MGNNGQDSADKPDATFITFAAVFKFLLKWRDDITQNEHVKAFPLLFISIA